MRKRKNFSLPDRQVEQLERRENLSEAEMVLRALDAYLAWNDPDYHPTPSPIRNGALIPRMNGGGFPAPIW